MGTHLFGTGGSRRGRKCCMEDPAINTWMKNASNGIITDPPPVDLNFKPSHLNPAKTGGAGVRNDKNSSGGLSSGTGSINLSNASINTLNNLQIQQILAAQQQASSQTLTPNSTQNTQNSGLLGSLFNQNLYQLLASQLQNLSQNSLNQSQKAGSIRSSSPLPTLLNNFSQGSSQNLNLSQNQSQNLPNRLLANLSNSDSEKINTPGNNPGSSLKTENSNVLEMLLKMKQQNNNNNSNNSNNISHVTNTQNNSDHVQE